jgi:hypothetical protein
MTPCRPVPVAHDRARPSAAATRYRRGARYGSTSVLQGAWTYFRELDIVDQVSTQSGRVCCYLIPISSPTTSFSLGECFRRQHAARPH